jgi:hypothetical protein
MKLTEPEVGGYRPAITLKVVLLPEPFGPISPRISPWRSSKLRLSTAVKPAKGQRRGGPPPERGGRGQGA